jgi:predicted nucleotidyltransferase component of viral defense system
MKFNLTEIQKKALKVFAKDSFFDNFYWTGGTLLAYRYLNHRHSTDLDFFSDNLFHDDQYLIFINQVNKKLKAKEVDYQSKYNRKIFNFIFSKNEILKTEFVFFPFKNIESRNYLEKFEIKTDSLSDIMVNKVLSAYQRNEVKDVYDLYFYLNNKPKYSFFELINFVEKKFGVKIEESLIISKIQKLLSDFKLLEPLIYKKNKNLKENIIKFFQKEFNKKNF